MTHLLGLVLRRIEERRSYFFGFKMKWAICRFAALAMSLLAEPRRKQRFSIDPQNVAWASESGVGKRLMKRMGWSDERGLGAHEQGRVDNLKLAANTTGRGESRARDRNPRVLP